MVTAVSWMNCEFAWRGEPRLGDMSRRQAWDRDGRSLQCARTAQGRTQHLLEEGFGQFTVSDFGQISALCLPVCWDFGYFAAQRGFCLTQSPSEGWYHLGSSYSGAWGSPSLQCLQSSCPSCYNIFWPEPAFFSFLLSYFSGWTLPALLCSCTAMQAAGSERKRSGQM